MTPHRGTAEAFARMSTRNDGTFHLLQLTDFHSDADDALRLKTYEDIRVIVRITKPDLLAVTGDIWCGDDVPDLAPRLMEQELEFLASLGIPWAFTWGNHDFVGCLEDSLKRIASTPYAVAPEGDRRGSFRIEIAGKGVLPFWDLYFLNSGPRWNLPGDVEWFLAEQSRLNSLRGATVPAVVFVHIPLIEYEQARQSGRYQGIAQEEVLHWGDEGQVFRAFKEGGGVRACFVGHSHLNDFHFELDGITLAYGRVTGHGGYGGYGAEKMPRGAKRIVLDAGGDVFFETQFADGSTWRPEAKRD